jgi:dUTP pyrophosphatase
MKIKINKITQQATKPTRANNTDAGYDLYASVDGRIAGKQRDVVNTGIQIAIPEGYYGRIAPRSGLAVKHGIDVLAGVVDSGYRGEVGVVLQNLGLMDFEYREGDRIAQLIIEKCHDVEWEEVESEEDLVSSERGEGGFGSTGE